MCKKLDLVPITQEEAFEFVRKHHRHHKPPTGSIFQVAVACEKEIVGVAIVGHPNARLQMDGFTAEVTRLCSDGSKNACSMMYSACWRAVRALGYKKLITFILSSEPGVTLYAAGWRLVGEAGGGSWNRKTRPRVDMHPTQTKLKFEIN